MPVDQLLDFDPYVAWLSVSDPARPVSPYALLRLQPLEDKEPRIKAAYERQRTALDKVQATTDPGLWDRISTELDAALKVLLDSDKKALLDAALRRRIVPTSKAKAQAAASERGGQEIACRKCRHANPSQRRFCSACGDPLWEQCGQCGAELPANERFCGQCGVDVRGLLQSRIDEMEAKLTEADELLAEYRYDGAFVRLKEVATLVDARLDPWVQRAVRILEGFEQHKADAKSAARQAYEKAQQCVFAHSYERGMALILDVHANLRTPEMVDLLASAKSMRDEILVLSGEIREAVTNKQFTGLLPKIERLLTLKPDHDSASKLARQLRDQLFAKAQRRLAEFQYADAVSVLKMIPSFVRTPQVEDLADKATELACLVDAVREAPLADDATLAIARRLAKAVSTDAESQKLCDELKKKQAARPADRRLACADAAPVPRRTKLGLPVDWLGHFTRIKSEETAVNDLLAAHPGRFFVALGLALQGVESAQVGINLMPAEKAGLLGGLSLNFGGKRALSAWGLDLSPAGLKALRLSKDKTGEVRLLAVDYIPHEKTLADPEAEPLRSELISRTLQKFVEKHQPDKQERIVSGLPGFQVLGRFFEIPPMPVKKVAAAVEYEAKHQFPIDLSELVWGHHTNDPLPAKEADDQARRMLVCAMREFQAKEQIARFKAAGLELYALQSDGIALHNAAAFEFFPDGVAPADDGAICLVDVGVEGLNVVVSSARSVWFRSIRQGTHDLTSAMVKQFKLTYDQAELLRTEPQRARRLYQLLDLWQPTMVQLVAEVSKSLDAYQKLYPQHPVSRVYGLGGGFRTFGLMRQLRLGR